MGKGLLVDVEKSDLNRHKVLNSGSILKSTALEAEKGISTETALELASIEASKEAEDEQRAMAAASR